MIAALGDASGSGMLVDGDGEGAVDDAVVVVLMKLLCGLLDGSHDVPKKAGLGGCSGCSSGKGEELSAVAPSSSCALELRSGVAGRRESALLA